MVTFYIKLQSDAHFFVTFMVLLMMFTPALTSNAEYKEEVINGFYLSKDFGENVIYAQAEVTSPKEVSLKIDDVYVGYPVNMPTDFKQIIKDGNAVSKDFEKDEATKTNFKNSEHTILELFLSTYGHDEPKICTKAPNWVNEEYLKEDTIKKLVKFLEIYDVKTEENFKKYINELYTEDDTENRNGIDLIKDSWKEFFQRPVVINTKNGSPFFEDRSTPRKKMKLYEQYEILRNEDDSLAFQKDPGSSGYFLQLKDNSNGEIYLVNKTDYINFKADSSGISRKHLPTGLGSHKQKKPVFVETEEVTDDIKIVKPKTTKVTAQKKKEFTDNDFNTKLIILLIIVILFVGFLNVYVIDENENNDEKENEEENDIDEENEEDSMV